MISSKALGLPLETRVEYKHCFCRGCQRVDAVVGGVVVIFGILLGSYVRVEIEGPEIEGVVELPRSVLQENNTIWVMDAGSRLAFRYYELVLGRTDTILARVDFEPDDQIITSPLGIAINGMQLETLEQFKVSENADRTDEGDGP